MNSNPPETAAIIAMLFANHGTPVSNVAAFVFFAIFIYRTWKYE